MKGLAGDLLGLFLGSSFLIGSGLNRQARVIRTERQRELRTEHNNSYLRYRTYRTFIRYLGMLQI